MPPAKGQADYSRDKKTIRRLQASVNKLSATINALEAQQRSIKAKTWLAALTVTHCDALPELSKRMQQLRGDGDDSSTAGGAGGATTHQPDCAPVSLMLQLLADHNSSAPAEAARALVMSEEPLPELSWSPQSAAELYSLCRCQVSTEWFRKEVRDWTESAGLLLARIDRGALDADEVRAQLHSARSRILEATAVVFLSGNLLTLSDVLVRALDADDPAGPGRELLDRQPSSAVPASHWVWAMQQMKLDPVQEERICVVLRFDLDRTNAALADMQELLQQGTDANANIVAREDSFQATLALQWQFQMWSVLTFLCVYGSLLSAEQIGAYSVGCWPYVPSLSGLRNTLQLASTAAWQRAEGILEATDRAGQAACSL